jgi:nitroreductase
MIIANVVLSAAFLMSHGDSLMMPLHKVELTVFETILARRSVRSYQAQAVDRVTIGSLLEAAVRAPTAIHQEPWAFVIISDRQLLHSLSDCAKPIIIAKAKDNGSERSSHMLEIIDDPDFNIFYDAGTLILICGRTAAPFYAADCWLAAENLMLAACAMGLGTCVIASALHAFNLAEIRLQLGIKDEFSVVAPIILGYPNKEKMPILRKPPLILTSIAVP